ncbi:MAG: RNA polymerase sigma factor [Stenotrophobium sp.]
MSAAFDAPIAPETLDQARQGERRAQESIYRGYERAVYNLARRMTSDPDAASDITQDTFLHAFKNLHQYRGESPFGHWLRAVAASKALMHLRAGRRFLELFAPDADISETVGLEDVSTLDLENALGLLPPVPRSVLWLYHVEGYTHPEIAQMCGKTVSFSKSQLSRAHQKLRQVLDGGNASAHKVTEAAMPELP